MLLYKAAFLCQLPINRLYPKIYMPVHSAPLLLQTVFSMTGRNNSSVPQAERYIRRTNRMLLPAPLVSFPAIYDSMLFLALLLSDSFYTDFHAYHSPIFIITYLQIKEYMIKYRHYYILL